MSKPISQAEARRLRKRVVELERASRERLSAWGKEWPEGRYFMSAKNPDLELKAMIEMARALKHAVVVTYGNGELHYHAVPLPAEETP